MGRFPTLGKLHLTLVFIRQTSTISTLFEMWICESIDRVVVSIPQNKENITPGRGGSH